jgi:hypothetical protein
MVCDNINTHPMWALSQHRVAAPAIVTLRRDRVETLLPCPYCETDNQVIIREDQGKAAVLYRKAEDSGAAAGYRV